MCIREINQIRTSDLPFSIYVTLGKLVYQTQSPHL